MAKYVHQTLRVHPALEPLRLAGNTYVLNAHTGAIWLSTLREVDGNGWRIKEKIEAAEWWLPVKRSRGDQITNELASRVRRRWEGMQNPAG